jgi:hypothetical protein
VRRIEETGPHLKTASGLVLPFEPLPGSTKPSVRRDDNCRCEKAKPAHQPYPPEDVSEDVIGWMSSLRLNGIIIKIHGYIRRSERYG